MKTGQKIDVLYIHGYNGSGCGGTATAISEMLPEANFNFISPQLSNTFSDVADNIKEINELITLHKPEIVIGNSLGGFEVMAAKSGMFKILINPVFNPITDSKKPDIFDTSFHTEESKLMIENIIASINPDYEDLCITYGFFGDKDDVVSCKPQFSKLFDKDKMVTIHNAGHQLNRNDICIVTGLIIDIYNTIVSSFDGKGYIKTK